MDYSAHQYIRENRIQGYWATPIGIIFLLGAAGLIHSHSRMGWPPDEAQINGRTACEAADAVPYPGKCGAEGRFG